MPEDGGGVRTARLDAAKQWPDVLVPDDAQAAAGGAGNHGDAVLRASAQIQRVAQHLGDMQQRHQKLVAFRAGIMVVTDAGNQ